LMVASDGDVTRFDHAPSDQEWEQVFATDCKGPVEALLGAPLDPNGRYFPAGVRPSGSGWMMGDRQLVCGLAARELDKTVHPGPDVSPENLVSFAGMPDAAKQWVDWPTGTCFGANTVFRVACETSHRFETTGDVDLTGRVAQVPGPDDRG